MSNRKGFRDLLPETLLELMIIDVIIGILAAIAIPSFINMQVRGKEAELKNNCEAVQFAAENFAVQNSGVYPKSVNDALPYGVTIINLLPDARLLENPFTKVADSPINLNGERSLTRGQVGYKSLDKNGDGVVDGYEITGFGKDAQIISLTNCQ